MRGRWTLYQSAAKWWATTLSAFVWLAANCSEAQQVSGAVDCAASVEPWGRYSASGTLVELDGVQYIYSIGGDTRSAADDSGGGVVRTNFRYRLGGCWERLTDSPRALGFRGTATVLNQSLLWVFGGGDASRAATAQAFWLSLPGHEWFEIETSGPMPRYKHAIAKLSETTALILGGRGEGTNVFGDAWLWDSVSWTLVSESLLGEGIYRHAMALSNATTLWVYGGIDHTLTRHERMWRVNLMTYEAVRVVPIGDESPGRRASHALEYFAPFGALVAFGGTCADDSQAWFFDIGNQSWCSVTAAAAPSRRDAFLWSIVDEELYIVGGDLICLEIGQVYGIADVHSLQLRNASSSWSLRYEPRNERDRSQQEACDGTNRGACRAPPRLSAAPAQSTSCPISAAWLQAQPTLAPSLPLSLAPTQQDDNVSLRPTSPTVDSTASGDAGLRLTLSLMCGVLFFLNY